MSIELAWLAYFLLQQYTWYMFKYCLPLEVVGRFKG